MANCKPVRDFVTEYRDNVNTTDCSPKYKLGEHVLRWSDETRDLGVIIDK